MRWLVLSVWLAAVACGSSGTPGDVADASADAPSDVAVEGPLPEAAPTRPPCTDPGAIVQCNGQVYGTCQKDGTIEDCSCYALGNDPIVVDGCVWTAPDDLPIPILRNAVSVAIVTSDDTDSVDEVPSESDCTSSGGYVFDDDTEPTTIELCPASCTGASASGATLEIAFGCRPF
jgi:hypothetical protein